MTKIEIIAESDDVNTVKDAISILELQMPYMFDNVVVTSSEGGPDEDACLFVESMDALSEVHPEACWYTIKATPTERVEHYIRRSPPCEAFDCEGFNVGGRWFDCYAPVGPRHEHMDKDRALEIFKSGGGL